MDIPKLDLGVALKAVMQGVDPKGDFFKSLSKGKMKTLNHSESNPRSTSSKKTILGLDLGLTGPRIDSMVKISEGVEDQ